MSVSCEVGAAVQRPAAISGFERCLRLWVGLCILICIALGYWFPAPFQIVSGWEWAQVNLVMAVLIWLMITPMLLKVDFGAALASRSHLRGVGVTLFVNWAVKPFSMALLAALLLRGVFAPWLPAEQLDSYIAGLIILAAAPCIAMVFVWSELSQGEPNFTLTQVALSDTIMVFAFAPIVGLLLGLASTAVPWDTLLLSVVIHIVLPAAVGQWRGALRRRRRVLRFWPSPDGTQLGPIAIDARG